MKKFKELRESYLEEKLKASDPAGTYIHDFVHSDNPKFAGKSKAKRIQMALAASYGAKGKSRNEELEKVDEADSTSLKMTTAGADVIHKDTGNKLGTVYEPTASRNNHVAVVHGPQGGPERKEFSSFKDAHNHIKKTYGLDEGMLEATNKDAVKQYTDIQKYKTNFNKPKSKPKSKPNPEEFLRISRGNTKKQQGVKEGMLDTVKTVAKKMGKALTGGSDQDQLKNLQKKIGMPQTGKKPTSK